MAPFSIARRASDPNDSSGIRIGSLDVPIYALIGICVAVATLLGLAIWLTFRIMRKRSRSKREAKRDTLFLTVKGVLKESYVCAHHACKRLLTNHRTAARTSPCITSSPAQNSHNPSLCPTRLLSDPTRAGMRLSAFIQSRGSYQRLSLRSVLRSMLAIHLLPRPQCQICMTSALPHSHSPRLQHAYHHPHPSRMRRFSPIYVTPLGSRSSVVIIARAALYPSGRAYPCFRLGRLAPVRCQAFSSAKSARFSPRSYPTNFCSPSVKVYRYYAPLTMGGVLSRGRSRTARTARRSWALCLRGASSSR